MRMSNNNNSPKKISVIGLGQMGKKIAEMLVQKEYDVTIWNRTEEKAKYMIASKIGKNVEEALDQSPVILICVSDNAAVSEILGGVRNKQVLARKSIINFTTGSPSEVKELESWLTNLGAGYLNGAIQVAPDQMGLKDTTLVMAGNREVFALCEEILNVLGGNIKFLGENASASPAMDMATLSWVYGSYVGLMYGVALCQKEGINLEDYRTIIGEIAPGFLEFYKYEIDTIRQGNFSITQSPLAISISASQRIAYVANSMGLDTAFTDVIVNLFQKAKDNGYEHEEVAAIIKVIMNQRSE
jgi:3-hydroxyisobutyrate dehydrogenase-like beta-hydroxyacid dehydrogenase